MIVIKKFSELNKAYIAKASLEAAGIDCFLADEHTTNLGFYTQAIGGARLFVNEDDVDKAMEILGYDFSADVEAKFSEDEPAYQCPACQSDNLIEQSKGELPIFICILLLGLPFLFFRRGYQCQNCGEFTSAHKMAEVHNPEL